jgi:hypothetical protein
MQLFGKFMNKITNIIMFRTPNYTPTHGTLYEAQFKSAAFNISVFKLKSTVRAFRTN